MQLTITEKDKFLSNFLVPVSKVSDSVILSITPGIITALVATNDNTIIVYASYTDKSIDITKTLNIPDIKKFCRIISCIEDTSLVFAVDSNYIGYTSSAIRFKYHLYEDNIITVPKININKLNALQFDASFSLTSSAISSLIKGSAIATETNKLYLSTKDSTLHGDLTDLTKANTDSYGMKLTDDYRGQTLIKPLPLNFEIIRIISCMKFKSIDAQIVTKMGVLVFNMTLESSNIKFIISALEN